MQMLQVQEDGRVVVFHPRQGLKARLTVLLKRPPFVYCSTVDCTGSSPVCSMLGYATIRPASCTVQSVTPSQAHDQSASNADATATGSDDRAFLQCCSFRVIVDL